jgi:hypothetical protein
MRFAYADPPYIGQAKRHYSHDPLCAEVDHKHLIWEVLMKQFPDGWALSASSSSMSHIVPLLPAGFRTGVWCKSFCAFKRNVRPAYAWEPVYFWGGRNPLMGFRAEIPEKNGKQTTPKDFIVEPITLRKGLVGAKPEKVCRWILQLLNVQPGDEVVDLYPGTGIMGRVAKEVCATEAFVSPQCASMACVACEYDDCACTCHLNTTCSHCGGDMKKNTVCSNSGICRAIEENGPDFKIQGKEW